MQNRYDAEIRNNQKVFHWTDSSELWDWDNCSVAAVKISENKTRIVIRSSHNVRSNYRKKRVKLKYMLGFDVTKIHIPKSEKYHQPPKHNVKNKVYGPLRERWVFQIDNDYWIWQWAEDRKTLEESEVYKLYEMLIKVQSTPYSGKKSIFKDTARKEEDNPNYTIIPVIYQPAIDSWKNFVREIHCHIVSSYELEVTILFNNENLREHATLNPIYEWFRSWFYGRVIDVETFRIILIEKIPENFELKGIYSGDNDLEQDDIHGDKPDSYGKVPLHKIKYYFVSTSHPIVFINTANHAMSEHDTNHSIWKWEYTCWEKDSPIIYGQKSREKIDKSFRPIPVIEGILRCLRIIKKYF
jgi:hypothetical protein